MGSWGRKTSNFCDKCAETFPELVDGACTNSTLHEEVKRRLADFPLCERCFDTYRRTTELCCHVARELPTDAVERLFALLRSKRDG